jgi:hypothetical protein
MSQAKSISASVKSMVDNSRGSDPMTVTSTVLPEHAALRLRAHAVLATSPTLMAVRTRSWEIPVRYWCAIHGRLVSQPADARGQASVRVLRSRGRSDWGSQPESVFCSGKRKQVSKCFILLLFCVLSQHRELNASRMGCGGQQESVALVGPLPRPDQPSLSELRITMSLIC